MSLDPRIVKMLNSFANSQPALQLPGEPAAFANPLLGDILGEISNNISGENSYIGSHSHQVLGPDLTVSSGVGSDDGGDPKYIATIMGNIFGDNLTNGANYLAGVIGAFSITGTKSTSYPAGAVLAQITDSVTEADGAFVAYVDGDSSVTTANAAFKAMSNNSNSGSGFNYGVDLYSPGHDGFSDLAILKADLRLSHEVCYLNGSGAPTTAGTGFANTGSQYVDRTSGDVYVNVGDKTTPSWKRLARFEEV